MNALDKLVGEVDAAIAAHERKEAAPFSAVMLKKVRSELNYMRESGAFVPSYPRFVLDWPDVSSDLGKALMNAAHHRGEALKRHK
jgi:hypothetical protein